MSPTPNPRESLPLLPLVLHDVPPGLEMLLTQEGVPWVRTKEQGPAGAGRFVLFDASRAQPRLHPGQTGIDIAPLRRGGAADPLEAVLGNRPARRAFVADSFRLVERVARVDRASIRFQVLGKLRRLVERAGGVWARIGSFPAPYRSAFHLRIDLDEPEPLDYWSMARERTPLNDCTSHFVCTSAYARFPGILADLRGLETHSHGHRHVVTRSQAINQRSLATADTLLRRAGIEPEGYAGPEGRWNHTIDQIARELGYRFTSEFQAGYDDVPFWPWTNGSFSPVLQIPVHPVCEGLFLDAGCASGAPVADYLVGVIGRKIEAHEPAFVYGHPERRLGRFPEILGTVARFVAQQPDLWRVRFDEFSRWWEARAAMRWELRGDGGPQFQFVSTGLPSRCRWVPVLELVAGDRILSQPLTDTRMLFDPDTLASRQAHHRPALDEAPIVSGRSSPRALLRELLDWETQTPICELPSQTFSQNARRWLRRWHAQRLGQRQEVAC